MKYIIFSLMAVMLFAGAVQAQSPVTPAGAGTEANPYLIASLGNLVWLANDGSFDSARNSAHYRQVADIDMGSLSTGVGFKRIGFNASVAFSGVYDGGGYTLSNLYVNAFGNGGLFAATNGAVITNLTIHNAEVTGAGSPNYGVLIADARNTRVENVHITGTVTVGSAGQQNIGGIVGTAAQTILENVSVKATVQVRGSIHVGGIVGRLVTDISQSPFSLLRKGIFEGTFTLPDGGFYAGGLVGILSSASVEESYAIITLNASGSSFRLGGLVGEALMMNAQSIRDSYVQGSITYSGSTSIGGFIGHTAEGSIVRSYAAVSMSPGRSDMAIGFIGSSTGTTLFNNNFFNRDLAGVQVTSFASGITSLTTAQMRSEASFTGFDFTDTWGIAPNYRNGYPHFQTEDVPPLPNAVHPPLVGNAYEISTWRHLYWLQASNDEVPDPSQSVRWAYSYRVTADIDLSAAEVPVRDWNNGEGFRPIGTESTPFRGIFFRGNNHTISGLYINRVAPAGQANGFFGFLGQWFQTTTVGDLYIIGEVRGEAAHTGGLAGHLQRDSAVENVAFYGSVHSGTTGASNTGGLVGTMRGSLFRVYANATVSSAGNSVGGLIGVHEGLIQDTYSIGVVSGVHNVGGLIGLNSWNAVTNQHTNVFRSVSNSKVLFQSSGGPFIGAFVNAAWPPLGSTRLYNTDLQAGTVFNSSAAGFGEPVTEAAMRTESTRAALGGFWSIGGPDGTTTYPYITAFPPKQLPGLNSVRQLTGSAGWRLISSPAATTYAELLSGIWTQGGTGANATNGTPNVYTSTMSTSAQTVPVMITDFTQTVTPGAGLAVYVFNADADGSRAGFPKTIRTLESPFDVDVTLTIDESTAGGSAHFALAGNPFAASIRFQDLLRTNVSDKIWVYDAAADRFLSRAAGAGDFNGLITPYTGFWIEHTADAGSPATLTFPATARTTGGQSLGKDPARYRIVLDARDGDFVNSAWIVMQEGASEGADTFDTAQMGSLTGAGLLLYTMVGQTPLDLNFIPAELDAPLEFPLAAVKGGTSTVQLAVREIHLPEGYIAELIDLSEGRDAGAIRMLEPTMEIDLNAIAYGDAPRYTLRITPGSSTSTEWIAELPAEVRLEQNFPNPFNPTTTIRFSLPETADVRLAVYDVTGREVALLTSGTLAAGVHQVSFDAARFASGVYLYRLQAGSHTLTRRMTLVK